MTKQTYAFPSDINTGASVEDANWTANGGMTMRDYFAAKAMNGELASMSGQGDECDGLLVDIETEQLDMLCTHWYRIADAMMKARTK